MKKILFLATILCLAIVPMLSEAQDSTKARNFQNRKALRERW